MTAAERSILVAARMAGAVLLSGMLAVSSGCARQKAETPAAARTGIRVTEVSLGRALGPDNMISEKTDRFRPADEIYASVVTDGAAASATIEAKWTYQDGQLVQHASQAIAPTGRTITEFHISNPDGWPIGKYRLEVSLNGALALAKEFEVAM